MNAAPPEPVNDDDDWHIMDEPANCVTQNQKFKKRKKLDYSKLQISDVDMHGELPSMIVD